MASIIKILAALAPVLAAPLKKLFEMLFRWIENRRLERAEKELSDAVKKSKDTKDTSNLDDSF